MNAYKRSWYESARFLFLVVAICVALPQLLRAQEAGSALSVTVTPPLFQLSIAPGETWASSLKVVNNNDYDVTYYANVVDFEAQGEDGKGELIPLIQEFDDPRRHTYSLASWVDISSEPIFVPRGQSGNVPFTVSIPQNAEPGGHYAAILVGTQPPAQTGGGPSLRISSFVSSLLFTKVSGEVVESGRVREFRTERLVYEQPEADFLLRFENTGNTHLRPQGDITIYNMWGKKRGEIAINQKSNFGNVLPESTRRFSFSWESDSGAFDIGRYSAVATLAFGDEGKQNASATTYFWVVPTGPLALTLGVLLVFASLVAWFIRRYIRRALALEKEHLALHGVTVPSSSLKVLIEPLREGVVDLRRVSKVGYAAPVPTAASASGSERDASISGFIYAYRLFFAFLLMLGVAGALALWSLQSAFEPESSFNISEVEVSEDTTQ